MSYELRSAPSHVQERASIISCYIQNQLKFLKSKYPNHTEQALTDAIKAVIKKRIKNPDATVITYKIPGEMDLIKIPLSTFIGNHKKHVITPSGTMFENDPENIPPSIGYCRSCRLDRKKFKKMAFQCFERGDMPGMDYNDKKQNLKKIKNNSMIGGNGFLGSAFYDKESFGAITSLSRNGVMLSYTLTEQCLANNFYWKDADKIYNHITVTAKYSNVKKDDILKVVNDFNLYVPTPKEATERLLSSAKYYLSKTKIKEIKKNVIQLFESMELHEMAYVFYRRGLYNLFIYNSDLFEKIITDISNIDYSILEDRYFVESTSPEDVFNIPEDVTMMMMIIHGDLLDYKAVNKDLVKDHPDIAKKFAILGKETQRLLEIYDPIYQAFMYHGETVDRVMENNFIIRKATAVSDTDSIIFTMKKPIEWYLKTKEKPLSVCDEGINASAYIVYILSRMLNIANRDFAISKGGIGDNIDLINLKSEFLYAVFVKTDLGKHYFAKYLTKEGRRQKEPVMDVKGVELQTSTLPLVSKQFSKDLMSLIIDDIAEHGNVYAMDVIGKCLEYEKTLLTSLNNGDLDYYANISIKDKEQYKDASKSIFFNYEWWQEVFAQEYGDIHIPGKYWIVPLKDKVPRSQEYLQFLKSKNIDIYNRYVNWLRNVPTNKRLGRIPIPTTLSTVPDILIPAIDMRTIIYKNLAPAQLILRQLGIGITRAKQKPLFMDIYKTSVNKIKSSIDEVMDTANDTIFDPLLV